jgi:hypothetical protein
MPGRQVPIEDALVPKSNIAVGTLPNQNLAEPSRTRQNPVEPCFVARCWQRRKRLRPERGAMSPSESAWGGAPRAVINE